MKRLIDWARQQRRQEKLKQAFRVYDWWRRSEANNRRRLGRIAAPVIYHWGVTLRPNWANGHRALGKQLERRYTLLLELKSGDGIQSARISWSGINDIGNRAVSHYQKVLELNPKNLETHYDLFSFLYLLGRIDEASIVLQQHEDLRRSLAEASEEDRFALRFVPTGIVRGIGTLGGLEAYIKAGLLGWRPPHEIIMLLPDGQPVSNPCFLNYWRQYITVVSDPKEIQKLSPLVKHLEDPIFWAITCNDRALFLYTANTIIEKQWDAEKRPSLMTLSASDYERGWRCLEGLGIPKGAWFVCLHVREGSKASGSKGDAFRNADVDTYVLAIKTVVAHGGWVFRMGDPDMKPLPKMEQVIDYALSDIRSDWLDVFLGAQCRFFIGTSSGLSQVAVAFGVPIVNTNYLPWNGLFFSGNDLFLPRLFWSLREQRHLTFTEIFSSPLRAGPDQFSYDRFGVEILENTPEEINDIVLEMLTRLEGNLTYSASDERLQEHFQSLTAACDTFPGAKDLKINCRIGKDYLRKYATLLEPPPQEGPFLQGEKEQIADLVENGTSFWRAARSGPG